MNINLFHTLSKYPFIFDTKFYSTMELRQNKTCLDKCTKKDCMNLLSQTNDLTEYTCSKGYDNILLKIGEFSAVLNGLIYTSNKSVPVGRKEVRKDWIVPREAVLSFAKKIQEIERHLVKRENETTIKNFSIFHDFKTSMKIIYSCTEEIISNLPGISFEEKLEGSGEKYQSLYHSLSLLTSQLRLIDIIANPQSISFGTKKSINIYQLFDKVKRLFEHLAEKRRDINISLYPEARIHNSYCHDSIEFIPLILLDNALKYAVSDSEIEIKMEQRYGKATIIVKNIGPMVSDENKEKIFEKFFRDPSAVVFSKEGMGVGLWVAQQILGAHQTKLEYFKGQQETNKYGLNVFRFDLPTITY